MNPETDSAVVSQAGIDLHTNDREDDVFPDCDACGIPMPWRCLTLRAGAVKSPRIDAVKSGLEAVNRYFMLLCPQCCCKPLPPAPRESCTPAPLITPPWDRIPISSGRKACATTAVAVAVAAVPPRPPRRPVFRSMRLIATVLAARVVLTLLDALFGRNIQTLEEDPL